MHEDFMRRAIQLARKPAATSPNPRVGAVVVRGSTIVGEGYHRGAGTDHGESVALAAAGPEAEGADLYVNLEPCAHHGRTPPCVEAIIAAGVRRVFVAIEDPDERVQGRGVKRLRDAGIAVELGLLEEAAAELNRAFLHQRTTGRPLITLKIAMSIDGRLAAADRTSRWITGEEARRHVHTRRAEVDAVLVGAGTAEADDPRLTARGVEVDRQPVRMLVDGAGRVAPSSRLFDGGDVLVATTGRCPHDRQIAWKEAGAEVLVLAEEDGHVDLRFLFEALAERSWLEILCEGGPSLSRALLAADLVDRLEIHRGSVVLGAGPGLDGIGVSSIDEAQAWRLMEVTRAGNDVITVYTRETR